MAEGNLPTTFTDNPTAADFDRSCEEATETMNSEMSNLTSTADDAALQRFLQQQRR